jgi:hypothetical protein
MRNGPLTAAALLTLCGAAIAADANDAPALTIYNQNFAVVRETIPLDLQKGITEVTFADATAHVEPDSVILRDPTGQRELRILEQNYRADPVTQGLLLNQYEGEELDFQVHRNGRMEIVRGRVIRSGYQPHREVWNRYGNQYYQRQMAYMNSGGGQPLIEMEGRLHFGLPGTPLFPALAEDSILKPTFEWKIASNRAGVLDAECAYVTGGMTWEADYNVIAPAGEGTYSIDLLGWVTMENYTGRDFEDARIKLMAGDVHKLQPHFGLYPRAEMRSSMAWDGMQDPVTERVFDEYHLYTLSYPTTLRDRQTKQVEFVRGDDVAAERVYVYDGVWIDPNQYRGWTYDNIRQDRSYGTRSNPKVWIMREFENTKANGLGIPLPAGRVRFYQQDEDGQLEFVGENMIDHTPRDETLRVYTGNAFDLVGDRTQTAYEVNWDDDWLNESFEIELRNHKDEPVEILVVERLYRWTNWEISKSNHDWTKHDSRTIEFRVRLEPNESKTISYTAHYTW